MGECGGIDRCHGKVFCAGTLRLKHKLDRGECCYLQTRHGTRATDGGVSRSSVHNAMPLSPLQTCHNFVGRIRIFKAKICINPYHSPMHRCITTLCTSFTSRCSLQNKSRYWAIKLKLKFYDCHRFIVILL